MRPAVHHSTHPTAMTDVVNEHGPPSSSSDPSASSGPPTSSHPSSGKDDMMELDETNPSIHTTSTTSAKDMMARIAHKKALAQTRNIPVLRRAPAVENEDEAGDELDEQGDDDDGGGDEEYASPKGKGKGKINLDNFEDVIIGAVRQAISAYAPEIGISINTTPKQTQVSSQRAAVAAERNTHSQAAKTRISVSTDSIVNVCIQNRADIVAE